MSVVINTNVDSTKIQNYLTQSTNNLSKTMERMSSGLKVKSAKDDASGCVISARMEVQLAGNKIAQDNVQNANSMMSTIEGNLDVVEENLSRIRDLTLQAKNGTYSTEEIKAMDDEVQERLNEINRISYSSKFSSLNLFNNGEVVSNDGGGLAEDGCTFQTGSDAGENNTVHAKAALFKSVEFSALTGAKNFSLLTIAGSAGAAVSYGENDVTYNGSTKPQIKNNEGVYEEATDEFDKAVIALDTAIDNITSRKSEIGSVGNRMDSALTTLTTQYENLESSNSLIVDADIAQEASSYTQASILQQVSTSLLAQANQAPSIATSLI